MRSRSAKADRLSSLPEELLSHVLSLMPIKYAMRTSILSKRWRYHWLYVTSLDFDFKNDHDFEADAVHMDRVLNLLRISQLKLFRLHFYGRSVRDSRISCFISKAIRLNVCELDIDVKGVELPVCLFTCKTLTTLKLLYLIHDENVWKLPSTVNLPCLKTLDICVYWEPPGNVFKLIHGCPLIESLTLRIKLIKSLAKKNVYNFNIPTLKRLELYIMEKTIINKVILNAPSLQYLKVIGSCLSPLVIEDLSSLLEATFLSFDCLLGELLRGISSGARSLSWYSPTIVQCMEVPTFSSFKRMELVIDSDRRFIASQLDIFVAIQLELLYSKLKWHKDPIYPSLPTSVPTCMLTALKTLLGNAKVLKTLKIKYLRLSREDEFQFRAQLLKFPRASTYCAVHFVGKHITMRPNHHGLNFR